MRADENAKRAVVARRRRAESASFLRFGERGENRPVVAVVRFCCCSILLLLPLSLGCGYLVVVTDGAIVTPASPPPAAQILLTERFDEGLMVLRNLLKWHLVDMTYIPVNKTAGRNGRTATGDLKDRAHFDNLPEDVREACPCNVDAIRACLFFRSIFPVLVKRFLLPCFSERSQVCPHGVRARKSGKYHDLRS